jgi:hypothetical protein
MSVGILRQLAEMLVAIIGGERLALFRTGLARYERWRLRVPIDIVRVKGITAAGNAAIHDLLHKRQDLIAAHVQTKPLVPARYCAEHNAI